MKTILIADDDQMCRDSIQRVFEKEGYRVESVIDVDSALDAVRSKSFDMVVCDYRMQGKTGLDLLKAVRLERPDLPVLMISGCMDAAIEQRALELGAFQLLNKPVRRRELIDRAAELVGGGYDERGDL